MSYIIESSSYKKKYKCPYCDIRLERSKLISHIEKKHDDMIPEGYSPARVVFNTINKKEHGTCTICGRDSGWDENKCRYNRICSDPRCKVEYKKRVEERIRATHNGKSSRDLLLDPNHQEKMLANRKISGTYKFSDGGERTYTGQYERKCLEFFDVVLNVKSDDITSPGPTVKYTYKGEDHFWITDIFYIPYNLVIECKDGGDNPNNRPMQEYREKQIAKEKAIAKGKHYNYLRLTNNNFAQLLSVMAELKLLLVDDNRDDRVVRVNESIANMAGFMPPDTTNNVYVVNYMKQNTFTHDMGVTKDIHLDTLFVQDNDGSIKEVDKTFLEDCHYSIYRIELDGVENRYKELVSEVSSMKEPHYIYEKIFNKKLYTEDQILFDTCLEEVIDYNQYTNIVYETTKSITEASILSSTGLEIPTANIIEGVTEYTDKNGYFIRNDNTGIRTASRKVSEYNPIELDAIRKGYL